MTDPDLVIKEWQYFESFYSERRSDRISDELLRITVGTKAFTVSPGQLGEFGLSKEWDLRIVTLPMERLRRRPNSSRAATLRRHILPD